MRGVDIKVAKSAAVKAGQGRRLDHWKKLIEEASQGIKVREFVPLQTKPHPRQAEIDAYRAIRSLRP